MLALFRFLIVIGVASSAIAPTLGAQQLDSLHVGVRLPAPIVDSIAIARAAPLRLSGSCHLSRVVAVGLAGYLGYLIGQLSQFPLALSNESAESVGINVAGAVAGVILIADTPLSRPLPFCPAEMHTLANRPTNHIAACRASRILNGGLGAAAGAVVAGAIALPFVLSNNGRAPVKGLFIALPAVGAIAGAIRAGHATPCVIN